MKSCLLCGVGGQGTVLASRIIAAAAMEKGLSARTAETIGMAQRGGCVVSHVRFGDTVPSPMIPPGTADALVGFEPGEAVRNLPFLRPGGVAVVSDRAIAAVASPEYDGSKMLEYLRSRAAECYVVDAERIYARCGSTRVLNVALVGALAACGAVGLTVADIEAVLAGKVKPQFLDMNMTALRLGAACVEGF